MYLIFFLILKSRLRMNYNIKKDCSVDGSYFQAENVTYNVQDGLKNVYNMTWQIGNIKRLRNDLET